ncbi:MAG: hypothetical protein Q8N53_12680 [Longimicrobiales bacterium]|nr:hypothetical protein [Longimicrobiales bacterium]
MLANAHFACPSARFFLCPAAREGAINVETDARMPLCLDAPVVAALLDVCSETVYQSLRRKALPSISLGARRVKVPTEAVEALLGRRLEPAEIRRAVAQVRQARERQRERRRHPAVAEPSGGR